jgi:protein TonB
VKFNFITPKVVDEDVESGMITQDELGNKNTSDVPVQLTDEKPADILPPVKVIETPVEQPPMVIVQEMPVFSGGEDEMYKYLAANIKYPQEARELGIQGKVYIEFVIEPDGSVSHVTVKRGIGSGCDEEAARVVSSMPKWNPGKQNGQAVRVLLTLPVKFVLN